MQDSAGWTNRRPTLTTGVNRNYARMDAVINADTLTDYFVYDGDGQRVRKTAYTNLATTLTDTFDTFGLQRAAVLTVCFRPTNSRSDLQRFASAAPACCYAPHLQ